MRILIVSIIIVFLLIPAQMRGEEIKKEKDTYALSYLCGYKCYSATSGIVLANIQSRRFVINAYKRGFGDALLITINEPAFDKGFQDAKGNLPSKYSEDILKK